MWNFKIYVSVALILMLCGCKRENENISEEIQPATQFVQCDNHFFMQFDEKENTSSTIIKDTLNYDVQQAMWISYLEYTDIMLNKTEDEFKEIVKSKLENAKKDGINTIYFQVRAFGDCYYNSELFSKGTLNNGDYDALEIFLEVAHSQEISVHAWLNPLRCQTEEELKNVSDEYQIKKWYNENKGEIICNVNGRLWLNPAYDEVKEFICKGVSEIVENYQVDGIHIDDYFYPTTDASFDLEIFQSSGATDLTQWRIDNINNLVSKMYQTVKNESDEILFGISPQGNISSNYSSQYADVNTWCANKGYCDYIVPQIYYGFENSACPFAETFEKWYQMTDKENVKLVVGLAVYKEGKTDEWAGDGVNEWVEDSEVISKQISFIQRYENVGYSFYK